jgi:hypothetical protein
MKQGTEMTLLRNELVSYLVICNLFNISCNFCYSLIILTSEVSNSTVVDRVMVNLCSLCWQEIGSLSPSQMIIKIANLQTWLCTRNH